MFNYTSSNARNARNTRIHPRKSPVDRKKHPFKRIVRPLSVEDPKTALLAFLKASVPDGSYNSQERYPPPRCYPGTCTQILEDIMGWVDAGPDEARSRVLWLNGPAGGGKSAIAQTICERCAERGNLEASFFFSRERGANTDLFQTIAYPPPKPTSGHRSKAPTAIDNDPLIVHNSMGVQLQKLTLQSSLPPPSKDMHALHRESPSLIVIDGLDECSGNDAQTWILACILNLVRTSSVPLRFMIVSRPEPHICHSFEDTDLHNITTVISLYDNHTSRQDVRTYLIGEFERLYIPERHSVTFSKTPRPFPSLDTLDLLVDRADGYFLYASALVKYVDDGFSSHVHRLEDVLKAPPLGPHPPGELDSLYHQVLSTLDINLLQKVLGMLLALGFTVPWSVTGRLITDALHLEPSLFSFTLQTLHSIISYRRESDTFSPVHVSLCDFIFDPGRAGNFYINRENNSDAVINSLFAELEKVYPVGLPATSLRGDAPDAHEEPPEYETTSEDRLTREVEQQVNNVLSEADDRRSLGILYLQQYRLDDAEQSLSRALELHQQTHSVLGEANDHQSLGHLYLRWDRLANAEISLSRALEIHQRAHDILGEANDHRSLGDLYIRQGRLAEAEHSLSRALELHQQTHSVFGEANDHQSLGELYLRQDLLAEAKQSLSRAVELYQQTGSIACKANCLQGLGDLYLRQARLTEAEKSLSRAVELHQRTHDVLGEANDHKSFGDLYMRQNRLAEAEQSLSRAVELYQRAHSILGEANCLQGLGDLYLRQARLSDAEESLCHAVELHQQAHDVLGEANDRRSLGIFYLQQYRLDEAEHSLSHALELHQQTHSILGEANDHQSLGELYLRQNRLANAEQSLSQSLELHQQAHDILGEANDRRSLGDLYMRQNRLSEAELSLKRAVELYQRAQSIHGESKSLLMLADLFQRQENAARSLSPAVKLHPDAMGDSPDHVTAGEKEMDSEPPAPVTQLRVADDASAGLPSLASSFPAAWDAPTPQQSTQSITASQAYTHVTSRESEICKALAHHGYEGVYSLHAGFNEEMILLGEQQEEIYIVLDSTAPNDIRGALESIVYPFRGIIYTPDETHIIPTNVPKSQQIRGEMYAGPGRQIALANNQAISSGTGGVGGSGASSTGGDDRKQQGKDGGQSRKFGGKKGDGGDGGDDGRGREGGGGGNGGGGGQEGQRKDRAEDDNDSGLRDITIPFSATLSSLMTTEKQTYRTSFNLTSGIQITVNENRKSNSPPPQKPWYGPWFSVDTTMLDVDTENGSPDVPKYTLGVTQVRFTAFSCITSTLACSPPSMHAEEDTVKTKAEQNTSGSGQVSISATPSLRLGALMSRTAGTERNQRRYEIVMRHRNTSGGALHGGEHSNGVLWNYAHNARGGVFERVGAESFEPKPAAVFGFDMQAPPSPMPLLEVEVVVYWSQAPRGTDLRSFFRGKRRGEVPTPAFLNFLHHVSVVVDLGRLKQGRSWIVGVNAVDKHDETGPRFAGRPIYFEQLSRTASNMGSSAGMPHDGLKMDCEIVMRRAVEGRVTALTEEERTGAVLLHIPRAESTSAVTSLPSPSPSPPSTFSKPPQSAAERFQGLPVSE